MFSNLTYAQAFRDMTGRDMTAEQERTARGIGNEAQAIDYLGRQIKAAIPMVSEHLGVAVEVSDIAHGLFCNDRTYRLNATNLPRFVQGIPAKRLIELGRASVKPSEVISKPEVIDLGFWRNLYWEELGREPDAAGLKFWKETVTKLFREGKE